MMNGAVPDQPTRIDIIRCVWNQVLRTWITADGWLHLQLLRITSEGKVWDAKEIALSPEEWGHVQGLYDVLSPPTVSAKSP